MRELAVMILCVGLSACRHTPPPDYLPKVGSQISVPAGVEYSFGVLPLHNAVRLYQTYEPLLDEINGHVSGFRVKLETAKDFPAYEAKVRRRRLEFLMMNSHLVIPSEECGYTIIGHVADTVRGLILVRNDSVVRTARDLKHESISFASGTDLPGAMMPKLLLKQNGLDVDRQAVHKYVGSPDSAILSVYSKRSAAACVAESAWRSFQMRRPDIAQALRVRWTTAPLIGPGILVRNDVPRDRVQSVARVLFHLEDSDSGRKILQDMAISRFEPANEATYDTVWEFLNDYRRAFGFRPSLRSVE